MVKKKIHVTGGKGFIGQNICNGLGQKYEVTFSDVDTASVLRRDLLTELFQKEKPDVVIHLAGLMGAQQSKKDLFDYFAVNSFGTLNVLEAASQCGIKNVVYFSSLTVHGHNGPGGDPKKESDPFHPQHPYATSKVMGEHIVREYARHHGIRAVTLRPTIIVGNLGGETNAVNEFVQSALEKKKIVIYGDGAHQREWLSVSDLVASVDKSVSFLLKGEGPCSEAFIISSGAPISMKNLAQKCIQQLGGGELECVNKNVQAFSLTSNGAKAKSLLAWEALESVDDIIGAVADKIQTAMR